MALPDFHLLETMRAENGAIRLLERHLDRLRRSAVFFGFSCDAAAARQSAQRAAAALETPSCLRLLLSASGECELETRPLPQDAPRKLRPAAERVNSSDIFLRHKTTRRSVYDQARAQCSAGEDVILVNERGEITEITIANIAVMRNGRWLTPPVSSGLLAGVQRAELLDAGAIVEGPVELASLTTGETIRCFNALRGVFDATFER